MDQTEFDELLERGRGNGSGTDPEPDRPVEEFEPPMPDDPETLAGGVVEEFDFEPEAKVEEIETPDSSEDEPPEVLTGEIVEAPIGTPENPLPYIKTNKSRHISTSNRETVPHPKREGCTCWYYPDHDMYKSDGSDGGQPGHFIQTPMHPKFKAHIYRTSEDGHKALQQNRDKKKAAMERGVRAAVAEHGNKALDKVRDEDAIEYTTKILTEEIVLNENAPARERWQFFVKMLEVNGIIDPSDNKGTAIAVQVNVDPAIGTTFK